MKLLMLLMVPLLAFALPATPAACEDPCVVESHTAGYLPPVVRIESGQSVVWRALDVGHATADGTGIHGESASCFVALAGPDSASPPIRFDILDGRLVATSVRGSIECAGAQPLPDGSFILSYHCLLHTVMRGTIAVAPAADGST